jgi:hypothetical protein
MQSLNLEMAEIISSLHRDWHCHLNLDKDFYCYRLDWRTLRYYRYWNMIGLANLVDCSFAYLHCQIIFQETFYRNTQYMKPQMQGSKRLYSKYFVAKFWFGHLSINIVTSCYKQSHRIKRIESVHKC